MKPLLFWDYRSDQEHALKAERDRLLQEQIDFRHSQQVIGTRWQMYCDGCTFIAASGQAMPPIQPVILQIKRG